MAKKNSGGHGPNFPGVPMTPLSPINITAKSLLPKAGANKTVSVTRKMPTPFPVGKTGGDSGGNRSGGSKPKNTSSVAAKKGTFGSRMGF